MSARNKRFEKSMNELERIQLSVGDNMAKRQYRTRNNPFAI